MFRFMETFNLKLFPNINFTEQYLNFKICPF